MKKWPLYALLMILAGSCAAPKTFEYRDVKNIKLDKVGFDKTSLLMDLVYYNPNGFGVNLKKVDADVYIDNKYLGKFNLDTSMHIPRKAEFTLPSKIDIDLKGFYKNALTLVMNNDVLVTVKGNTRVGKAGIYTTVPFTYEGRHKLTIF
ncbi:MAG: LEA type 2 family protein [Chitinophagaceae bacterium]|nr:LEA type 2 family protein [Chitinophagaceae bacterium]